MYNDYMKGSTEGDTNQLTELIYGNTKPIGKAAIFN
jgi:hypothetical protein